MSATTQQTPTSTQPPRFDFDKMPVAMQSVDIDEVSGDTTHSPRDHV